MKKMLFLVVLLISLVNAHIQLPEFLAGKVTLEDYSFMVNENWLQIKSLNQYRFKNIDLVQPGEGILLPDGNFYKLPHGEHAWRAAEYYTIKCFMAANQQPKTKMNYRFWLPVLITVFFLLIAWLQIKRPKIKKRAHTLQEALIKNNMPL